MGTPYIGEIRMFGGNFAPAGWALCNGAVLPISENDVLFSLIGTTYGGDGQSTFALPNLQSRIPLHQGTGQGFVLGQAGGEEQVTLTGQQLPIHNHAAGALSTGGNAGAPTNAIWAQASQNASIYFNPTGPVSTTAMNPNAIGMAGGSQPHDNMSPFLAVNFIIALEGIYPTPS